ncbi:hypothetical protein [Aliidiomarina quisquiliarum]|uniref:hypothetical protein n=1 Tax=Aliidiomarina quisquiliarum TaxID=2938947 RepID=UPI00208F3DE3|nr:hypothetical protein [Aliidiomarina quisquiliarum]MCO4320541.1 hypothetical protein [Aliidiomarina quisquiliarum]
MDEKNRFKHIKKLLRQGADDIRLRTCLVAEGLTLAEADQYILREKTKASFFSVRWPAMLLGGYLWAAFLYAGLQFAGHYTELSMQTQAVNLATFALALFVVGLLFRPKPQGRAARNIYTNFELAFAGSLIALTFVLFQHKGWASPRLPEGGAFASSIWPLLWLGAWVGPQVLAIVTLFIGHYALLNIRTSYFLHRQGLLLEQRREALRAHYQVKLAQAKFVPTEQVANLAQKLAVLLLSNAAWRPKPTVEIYSLGKQIHVRPLGGDGAVLTVTELSPPPVILANEQARAMTPPQTELEVAPLEFARYVR